MALLSDRERTFLRAVAGLSYCNPFLPERLKHESDALGPEFVESQPYWSLRAEEPEEPRANVWRIVDRLRVLLDELRPRIAKAKRLSAADLGLYEDAALYFLYHRFSKAFYRAVLEDGAAPEPVKHAFYGDFLREWTQYLQIAAGALPKNHEPRHTFACFFQIHRAFHNIFSSIIGSSTAAARLRAAVWESIFTHDMQRYARTLYARMGEFATLITGPSGTGKELVARAIALSAYRPFDEKRLTFNQDPAGPFHAINVASLSPALVESELFGHRRGAFTGALEDRRGWLETCTPLGSVFLDEIGDLDPGIQVKLLRAIETRSFIPVGDVRSRRFEGKLIVATNRNLPREIERGNFREDLYFRICSDQVVTPSLREQMRENPEVLRGALFFIAKRLAGTEADAVTAEVEQWIRTHLDPRYEWPGNYRELEQCVKNVLIRRDYRPAGARTQSGPDQLLADLREGRLTAEELLARYCAIVYRSTGSYEETARRLKIDRRTVKAKIASLSANLSG